MSKAEMSREEVAVLLGVSTYTIARWTAKGAFPAPLAWVGRKKLYSREEVLEWLEARVRAPKRRASREQLAQVSVTCPVSLDRA